MPNPYDRNGGKGTLGAPRQSDAIVEVKMATPPLYVVVRLWIRAGREAEFEAYESKVSRIMARYGGGIDRAIRASNVSEGSDGPFEVHLLKFPSRVLYDAYLADPERRSLSGEREGIVMKSDSLLGAPGPAYG